MYWASHRRSYRLLPILCLAASLGFAGAGYFDSVPGAVASFCVAAMGLLSALPLFWSSATGRLSGRAAGTAIAFVNSVGAVGAFAGPYVMGWLHDRTHSYVAGLFAIAGCVAVSALLNIGAAVQAKPAAANA
jgi:ACS family tartrate transporter-like MFS transporter